MRSILLQGTPAFSEFRIAALMEAVRRAVPNLGIARIEASFVYLINAPSRLGETEWRHTLALLTAQGPFQGSEGFFVTPRKGTISPWSSKATDIFHNCGLTDVLRVERGIHYVLADEAGGVFGPEQLRPALCLLHDRMTEGVYAHLSDFFATMKPARCSSIDVIGGGIAALREANTRMGLALSEDEMEYLYKAYAGISRNPTDVELVMFGQVNSEHCRHKIFNADWILDGSRQPHSLFGMIRNTHETNPQGTLVAYRDNSSVVEGFADSWFEVCPDGNRLYHYTQTQMDLIMKVETHNHPTAICPYPGASTGVGGEIRDEGATGIGGRSKAGLSAFMVSNLRIPGYRMPWELDYADFPSRLATPLSIMIEGPIGGAGFGNEYGRPQLCGLFRTYEQVYNGRYRGYHKPIMVAGGMGNIKREHVHKKLIRPGALILQLGGPAMRIGLGGGAASSMATGSNAEDLDFDSVQRGNAEMQRRCHEVIAACIALGPENPIVSVHDIGAGGLSNGCTELVSDTGGTFELRKIHNEDLSMSPMEIWCCEAQERYVLAVEPHNLDRFLRLCERERCPVAVLGEATGDMNLSLTDDYFENKPIDIDIRVILGKPPKMLRDVRRRTDSHAGLSLDGVTIAEAAVRVLRLPAVANKTFLITIADRSVTGQVARDQMVGPYQVPVSDVAVTTNSYQSVRGESMAMGERTPIALISGPASGRMAIGEALTNIAAADVGAIGNVKLSGNWMCACGEDGEDAALYDTVRAVGMELCPRLGVSIPVGKDSLSMRTVWQSGDGAKQRQVAPLSLIASAFAPVRDVRKTLTPELRRSPSVLFLIDLGKRRNRLGGSALAQVYNQVGCDCPDLDDPELFVRFFDAVQESMGKGLLLAYHDRSDGGLFVTLAEMTFASRMGARVDLAELGNDPLAALFSEELGAVLQVDEDQVPAVREVLERHGVAGHAHRIGSVENSGKLEITLSGQPLYSETIGALNREWSELTCRMQKLRDNPECAQQEYDNLLDETDPGMNFHVTYNPAWVPNVNEGVRPRMAILREQGVNGQVEMAAAFDRAGFECADIHMTDLLGQRSSLDDFIGLVACGGFSYGDVLGAGAGWAKSALYNEELKEMFARFFARAGTFALGVCNGCQMMSQLKDIIPGAGDWPSFTRNCSEQFEARYATVEVLESPSIFFSGMTGARIPVAVAHGEGFANFSAGASKDTMGKNHLAAVRFVDNRGLATERYPYNPNGSPEGLTGLTTRDGRVTIMMPHPERGFRSVQMSYRPAGLFREEEGPWMRMFRNARAFVG
jgi:phosphoribosylformylglycinamidine synthase